ncbi:hypothetical protein LQR30_18600 [Chromobacterium piscinae]|uniref:reverse transcriptase domain-containing protein n=1 Tax=Chromobacterium piscinae TaxID=686831 RepID=UPI001E51EEE0|nr:reverse transcriptase domain-containing protein [Chromobacterium piscinae]MCD4506101.1 hypothetical protein [Chromobacterium piscinae]
MPCSIPPQRGRGHPPCALPTAASLESARAWLWRARAGFPASADIWHLRRRWHVEQPRILAELQANRYRLSAMQVVRGREQTQVLWCAADALVIKWLTEQLTPLLPVHPRCEHVRGHGGGPSSCLRLQRLLRSGVYRYVCRTDIQGYYAHIDKQRLLAGIARHVRCPRLLNLVRQFIHYSVEDGGDFHTPTRGIARASSLSPLLAAFYLYELDCDFAAQTQLHYVRYMDDFVILAATRWQLRRAVRRLNLWFAQLGVRQHPDKTFIGAISKGFDWMGFQLDLRGLIGQGKRALQNHAERCRRLYEQMRKRPAVERAARMVGYLRSWLSWAKSITASAITKTTGPIAQLYVISKCNGMVHEVVAVGAVVKFSVALLAIPVATYTAL